MSSTAPNAPEGRMTRGELARTQLIVTAERLYAEHGIDNVSLRQIASEAGYINPATIQYHFGTRTALLEAIVEHRVPSIDQRRLELFAEVSDDLDGLAEVMARPMLELEGSSHYAAFVAALLSSSDAWQIMTEAVVTREGDRRMHKAYVRLLPDVAPELRTLRMRLATSMMLHGIADRRRRAATGRRSRVSEAAFERELMAAMAAVLKSSGTG
jgi:AcrR family transcriptional regulator